MDEEDQSNASITNLWIDDLMHSSVFFILFLRGSSLIFILLILLWGTVMKCLLSTTTCLGLSVFFIYYMNKNYSCSEFFSKSRYTACKLIVHLYRPEWYICFCKLLKFLLFVFHDLWHHPANWHSVQIKGDAKCVWVPGKHCVRQSSKSKHLQYEFHK